MFKHRMLALFVMIFLSHLASDALKSEVKSGKPTSAPHSYPNQMAAPAQTHRAATSSNPYQNTVDALEVRRQYIDPILNQHWQKPIHCQKLIDDEQAFAELKELFEKAIPLDNLVDLPPEDRDSIEMMQNISPELERRIQEKTEEKMILGHPTRSTIKILAEFWEKYPCTESGIISLFKINEILNKQTRYARVAQDGTTIYPYREFGIKLNDYILNNYPDCWETAILRRKTDPNNRYKVENAKAWETWIVYVESHDVLNNKYYSYYTRSSAFDNIRLNYSMLFDIYQGTCKEIGQKGIGKDGKLPSEAIEMYQKYYDLWGKVGQKYPQYYKATDKDSWYGARWKARDCYRLIDQYAPQYAKHKKEDLE